MTYTIKKHDQINEVDTYLQQRISEHGEVLVFTGNPDIASWRPAEDLEKLFELLPYFMDRDLVGGAAHFDYDVVDNEFNEVWIKS